MNPSQLLGHPLAEPYLRLSENIRKGYFDDWLLQNQVLHSLSEQDATHLQVYHHIYSSGRSERIRQPLVRLDCGISHANCDSTYNFLYLRKIRFLALPTCENRVRPHRLPIQLTDAIHGADQDFDICSNCTANGSEDSPHGHLAGHLVVLGFFDRDAIIQDSYQILAVGQEAESQRGEGQ